jgi:hypothetical protein
VSGHLDEDEDVVSAMIRKAAEEIVIMVLDLVGSTPTWSPGPWSVRGALASVHVRDPATS